MPTTSGVPACAISLYYSLAGNNNNTNPAEYRSHNPWKIAKQFCHDLPRSHSAEVLSVTTFDDSVFFVTLQPERQPRSVQQLATAIIEELARAIQPPMAGDRIVAVAPVGGLLQEIVNHIP